MAETNKAYVVGEFRRQASGLRQAAQAVNGALVVAENEWGPREVLTPQTGRSAS